MAVSAGHDGLRTRSRGSLLRTFTRKDSRRDVERGSERRVGVERRGKRRLEAIVTNWENGHKHKITNLDFRSNERQKYICRVLHNVDSTESIVHPFTVYFFWPILNHFGTFFSPVVDGFGRDEVAAAESAVFCSASELLGSDTACSSIWGSRGGGNVVPG